MSKTWNWYVAKNNELFIDCDHWQKSQERIRKRLMGAIECHHLFIENLWLYPSQTNGHMHIIIKLQHTLNRVEQFCWEIMFHSDIYRGCCNLMRRDIPAADILISRKELHRIPDATCNCETKHNYKTMETCPAAILLRGNQRCNTFFGKPSDSPCPWF